MKPFLKTLSIILTCIFLFSAVACGQRPMTDSSDPVIDSTGSAPAAEGEAKTSTGPVEVVVWNQYTIKEQVAFYDSLLQEYNKSQDKIKLTQVNFPFQEYAASKLATAFATGAGPDIFETSPAFIGQYIDSGVCLPLNDYITKEMYDDFIDNAFYDSSRGDVIYGIPINADIVALYYDVDVLKNAGVNPPKTWQELLDAAVKLNTDTCAGYTFDLTKGAWQNFTFFPFVWQQGGELFRDGKALLNSTEVVNALQFWRDLLDSGGVNEKPSRPVADISIIGDGETAMQICGSWSIPSLEKNYPDRKIEPVPLPIPDGGKPASVAGGWRWMVNKNGKAPEEAAKFLQWLWLDNPPEHMIQWNTDPTLNFSYAPRKSAIEKASSFYGVGLRKVFSEQVLPTAKPEIAMPSTAAGIVEDMIQDALYNMKPAEAAEKAQKRMEEFLKTFKGEIR